MQPLSQLILETYQVRKTKKQKTAFIELIQSNFNNVSIEQGGICGSRNIVVGNIENAKVILTAHYDTAPVLPFPNFLAPKNMLAYLGYCFLLFGLFFIISVILSVVSMIVFNSPLMTFVITYALLIFCMVYLFIGKENKHTANDNTSGVITLVEVLNNVNLKDEVCCVFFDHEEVGLFGSMLFAKMHKEILKDKLLINFDCVGEGDHIMLIYSKLAEKYKHKLETSFQNINHKEFIVTTAKSTLYPSDQMNFKNNIGVASFKKNQWIGYYMDKIHTAKDTTCDMTNIEAIIKGLEVFVHD